MIPKSFSLGILNYGLYGIYTNPSGATSEITTTQNIIKITIPITGNPNPADDEKPSIEEGSTMTIQFNVSNMVISTHEDGPAGSVYISWKSANIGLIVTSSLVGGMDEVAFNTAMTTLINTFLTKDTELKMKLRFGIYGKIVNPTYWNFIAIPNGSSNQLTALAMFDYQDAPPQNQNSVFQFNDAIKVPDGSNIIISLADYTILEDVETLLINKGFGIFDDSSFNLTQENGQSKLSLASRIALVKNLFINLITFTVNIVPNGLKFLVKIMTPIVIFEEVTATANAVPNATRETKGQAIDITLKDTKAEVNANVGCILTVAFILIMIILLAAALTEQWYFLLGIILVIIAAIVIYYVFKGVADDLSEKLEGKMEDFQKTRYNKNQNFFINDIVYNEAIIMQGVIGSPDFTMSLENDTTQSPVIYANVETNVTINLINNTLTPIALNDSSSESPTKITIQLPDFFNSVDYADIYMNQPGWSYELSGQLLTLTNSSVETWDEGAYYAIPLTIRGLTCSNETNATDSVLVTVENTSYPNEIETAARLTVKKFEPTMYPITWEIVNDDKNGFQNLSESSGTATVDSSSNTFIVLATATLENGSDEDVVWQFGYQFTNNTNGQPTLTAKLQSTGRPSQEEIGTSLPIGSTATSTAYYKNALGNFGIAINFKQED